MSAVAFADFFRSMMAFAAIFSYLRGRVRLTIFNIKCLYAKNAPNQADSFANFRWCYWPKVNFSVALLGQIYRLWKWFFSSFLKRKSLIYLLTDRPLTGNWYTILLSLMSTASVMKTASWFYTPTMEAVEIRPLTNLRDRKGPNLLLRPQNQPNIYQIQEPNLMSRIGK